MQERKTEQYKEKENETKWLKCNLKMAGHRVKRSEIWDLEGGDSYNMLKNVLFSLLKLK